ncbi:MAG: Membrane protein insertase MisCB precursor [Microgenomates bacterium OLB22]|nr:MAG: Membrane protein insertase MisCB precursor [Microgenomates bacterium OLB22]
MGTLFTTIFVIPTINILLFFLFLFTTISLPGAFGFSIIALTGFVRILVHPLYIRQMQLARKMEEMKPRLDALSKKHQHDKPLLQKKQMELYKEMGVNPATGCVLALLQIPLAFALYESIRLMVVKAHPEVLGKPLEQIIYAPFLKVSTIDPFFFGYNLAVAPSTFMTNGYHYLLIPVLTAILQYAQVAVTAPQPMKKTTENSDGKKKEDDMSAIMATQMKIVLPIMIGLFSYQLPVGLSLYWNMFSISSIIQYEVFNRDHGKKKPVEIV